MEISHTYLVGSGKKWDFHRQEVLPLLGVHFPWFGFLRENIIAAVFDCYHEAALVALNNEIRAGFRCKRRKQPLTWR
jgi:hypothetical protein